MSDSEFRVQGFGVLERRGWEEEKNGFFGVEEGEVFFGKGGGGEEEVGGCGVFLFLLCFRSVFGRGSLGFVWVCFCFVFWVGLGCWEERRGARQEDEGEGEGEERGLCRFFEGRGREGVVSFYWRKREGDGGEGGRLSFLGRGGEWRREEVGVCFWRRVLFCFVLFCFEVFL